MVGAQNGTATAQAAGVSAVAAPLAARYRRREPERTLLHGTVRAHWKTFLAGFSLYAAVHLHANDREGLAHLSATAPALRFRRSGSLRYPTAGSPTGSSARSATAARRWCCSPPSSCAASPRWSHCRAPTSSAIMVCVRPPQAGAVRSSRRRPIAPPQRVRPAPPRVWSPRIPRLRRPRLQRPISPLRRYGAPRIHRAFPGPSC